ncbi:MAG: Ig-like domain-containing protein [Planctomycetes bacterium]|nr:Ig-like domain-containing protein [Planctomycetota bacterium]
MRYPRTEMGGGEGKKRASLLLVALLATSALLPAQTEVLHLTGFGLGDSFGLSVASAGDVNGDGKPDILVASPFADPGGLFDGGSVYVLSGTSGALLLQIDGSGSGELFGFSVAGLGDLDGDGASEVLVGNPAASPGGIYMAGRASVHSGASAAVLFAIDGVGDFDTLGMSVAGLGDANGDGVPDFAVGASGADPGGIPDAGEARLASGASGATLLLVGGAAPMEQFGSAVGGAGDLDGDGLSDLLVGAAQDPFGATPGPGYVLAFSGASGAIILSFSGASPGDAFGLSVSGGRDVDGDSVPDLLVGSPFADVGGIFDAGSASAFSGASGAVLFTFPGTDSNGSTGQATALAGDMDGDGRSEMVVGAPFFDAGPLGNAGQATIHSGADGAPLFSATGNGFGATLGFSVAGVGDVDGDGRAEAAFGVPGGNPDAFTGTGEVGVFKIDGAVDNLPPVVTVLSPVDGALVNTTSVAASVLVSDASATSVVSAPGGLTASLPPGGGSAIGDVPLLLEGSNSIVFTATDASGNSTSVTVSVDRDTTPPVVTLLSPADGASVSGSVLLSAEASGVDLVSLALLVDGADVAMSTSSPLSAPFDFSGSSGSRVVTAVATDLAGNSASDSATVSVAAPAPPSITFELTPDNLPLNPNTSPTSVMTAHITGSVPSEGTFELRVSGGPAVPETSSNSSGTVVKFNRRCLVLSIRCGVKAGAIDPNAPVQVTLAKGGQVLATTLITVAMPATL